jgi:predicted ribosomally synthesized peptide with nif11-like leader
MSVKNVKAFYEKVAEDKVLQAKLKALSKKADKALDPAIAELVKIAKAEGFAFTSAEFVKTRTRKPSVRQAGGPPDPGVGCMFGILYVHVPTPPCPNAAYNPPPPPPPPDYCPKHQNACSSEDTRE